MNLVFQKQISIGIAAVMSVSITSGIPAYGGEVDPKVHKLCIEAKDYVGCVEAMTGQSLNLNLTKEKDTEVVKGNHCPDGYAHIGGGNCREVRCGGMIGRHNPLIGGKDWKCKGLLLKLSGDVASAYYDENCPNVDFKKGWNNTCNQEERNLGVYTGRNLPKKGFNN